MRYYRYLNFQRGIEALESGRLRLSSVSWFNDPFDGYGIVSGKLSDESCWRFVSRYRENLQSMYVRALGPNSSLIAASNEEYVDLVQTTLESPTQSYFLAEAMREWFISPRYRMLCLSRVEGYDESNDILMWSHYADSCRGMRIELEMKDDMYPGFRLRMMRYGDCRPMLDLSKTTTWDDNDLELTRFVDECLWNKSRVWSYENEARLVVDLQSCVCNVGSGYDANSQLHYAYVNLGDAVQHVDLGCSVDPSSLDDFESSRFPIKRLRNVSVSQMKLSLEEYRVQYAMRN